MSARGARLRVKRWLPPAALALLLAGAFALGGSVRRSIGLELSLSSLRSAVGDLGPMAPIAFFGIVVFRNFLALPSVLLLTSGGVLFGVATATWIGGGGILLSGLLQCGSVRWLGRDWVRGILPAAVVARIQLLEQRIGRGGPIAVALSTAHPVGVLAPLHWAYGLTELPMLPFAVALLLTAPLRAYLCASFGASLAEPGSAAFWRATLIFLAAALLPLAIPALRRRILFDAAPGARRLSSDSDPA